MKRSHIANSASTRVDVGLVTLRPEAEEPGSEHSSGPRGSRGTCHHGVVLNGGTFHLKSWGHALDGLSMLSLSKACGSGHLGSADFVQPTRPVSP